MLDKRIQNIIFHLYSPVYMRELTEKIMFSIK